MPLLVRLATSDDAPAIARVHVDTWRAAYRGLVADEYLAQLSVGARTERWREILSRPHDPKAATRVALRDDAVIGFVSNGPSRDADADAGTGEVLALYVAPEAWSTGAGRALMEAAFDAFRAAAHHIVTLWVLHGNERAIHFYERAGFRADGASKVEDRGDVKLDELRYRIVLPAK